MKKKDPFSKRKEPPRISKNWIHLSEDLIGLVCFSRLLLWLEAKNSVIIFVKIENQSKIRFQKRKIYDVLISRFAVLRYQFSNMTEKITKTILSKMTLFHRVLNSRWQISHHLIVKTIDNRKRSKKGYKNALKSSNYLNMDRKWFKYEPKMVKSLKIGLKKISKGQSEMDWNGSKMAQNPTETNSIPKIFASNIFELLHFEFCKFTRLLEAAQL